MKVDFLAGIDPLKVVGATEAPGSSSIATYESVTYNLKMIADTLGIDNKEFMVLQAAPVSMRLAQMRDSCKVIIEFIDE